MKSRKGTRIIDLWDNLLANDSSEVALLNPQGHLITRGEIDERARAIDDLIGVMDIRVRSVVALCLPNGIEWMANFIACLRRRLVPVFIDFGTSEIDLHRIAESIGAAVICDGKSMRRLETFATPKVFRDADVAMGKMTSGSTGMPKCLFFKDSEMIADGRRTAEGFGFRGDDLTLGLIPWGHAYGLGNVVMPFLILGNRVCWLDGPFPSEIEACFKRLAPTVFPSVPTVIKALAHSELAADTFRSLRVMVTAGSRLDPEVAREFAARYGVYPRNLYGSSETGSICFDPEGTITCEGKSVGYPFPGVSVSTAHDGRLVVESSATYTYGNRQRAANGDGRCVMGDFGELDADGAVRINVRAKGFVKVGEKRVGLGDVESRLEALPGVRAAQAIALESAEGVLLAAVVESSLPRAEIARLFRAGLAARFRPRKWLVVESIPVTARGKRDRQRMVEMLAGTSESM